MTWIISHSEDTDGIVGAYLLKTVILNKFNVKLRLVTYSQVIDTLKSIPDGEVVYIVDIGQNEITHREFMNQIRRFEKVLYFDHHPLTYEQKVNLYDLQFNGLGNLEFYHDVSNCTSVIIYQVYQQFLHDFRSEILVACAAVADYLDDTYLADSLVTKYDKSFVLAETGYLSSLISLIEEGGHETIVDDLATIWPHNMDCAIEANILSLEDIILMTKDIPKKGVIKGNFAYYITEESAAAAANLVVGLLNTRIGIGLKKDENKGIYSVSFRRKYDDLTRYVPLIAKSLGTGGGGHPRASGMTIRIDQLEDFIKVADQIINGK